MISGIVAVETEDHSVRFFRHDGASFQVTDQSFEPFFLSTDPAAAGKNGTAVELAGDAALKWQIRFPGEDALDAARKEAEKAGIPVEIIRSPVQQALSLSGERLFSGMSFSELRRMQIDFDSGALPLTRVELCTNYGFEQVLETADEAELLAELERLIRELDPDVIEGHQLCRNLLPALESAGKRCKTKLLWGRENRAVKSRSSRLQAGERAIPYNRYHVYGRHVVDTWHLALFFDISARDLEAFDLDYLSGYFNLRGHGAAAVRELSERLSAPDFYCAGFLPLNYQDVITRGNGSCLDALFLAEYISRGESCPFPEEPVNFQGALSRSEKSGVFHNVCHCDVRSLYPSLLVAGKLNPGKDRLGIFHSRLAELRRFRLEAKDRAAAETDPVKKAHFRNLQQSFKILINSFYGYLGFPQGHFNDYALAAEVTARGRELLEKLLKCIEGSGGSVIELDTDGIYFNAKENMSREDLKALLDSVLPDGIEIELDAVYPAMLSYKSKNYALLEENGNIKVTGAALKSRSMEPFARDLIFRMLDALLHDRGELVPGFFEETKQQIAGKRLDISQLARSETLNESPSSYKRKLASGKGRRSAVYELALASGREYRAGDRVYFYITGEKKKVSVVDNSRLLEDFDPALRDENTAFYINKADELYTAFSNVFGEYFS